MPWVLPKKITVPVGLAWQQRGKQWQLQYQAGGALIWAPHLFLGGFSSFLHSNREYHPLRPEAELGLRKFQAVSPAPIHPSRTYIWSFFLPSLQVLGAAVCLPDSCCGSVMAGSPGSQAGFACKAYSFGSPGSFPPQP